MDSCFIKRSLIGMFSLLMLQSCQHHSDVSDEVNDKKKRLSNAAGYNVQLGLEYLKQGNISRSKRKLLTALEQAPNSPEANAAMAYFMEKTGEMERAKSYYQKAMTTAPGRGTQLNNYGAFLCRQGDYAQAETYFLQAVNDLQYEHTSGAYENAGLCAMAVPNDIKAKQYFLKALGQDPSRRQSLYEVVNIDLKQHQYEDALKYLKKYPELVLHSNELLALAAKSAHEAGQLELEANYRRLLDNFSGVKHHDNPNNNNG